MKTADWKTESAKAHAAYMAVYNNPVSTDADKSAAWTVYDAAMNEVGKMVRATPKSEA